MNEAVLHDLSSKLEGRFKLTSLVQKRLVQLMRERSDVILGNSGGRPVRLVVDEVADVAQRELRGAAVGASADDGVHARTQRYESLAQMGAHEAVCPGDKDPAAGPVAVVLRHFEPWSSGISSRWPRSSSATDRRPDCALP